MRFIITIEDNGMLSRRRFNMASRFGLKAMLLEWMRIVFPEKFKTSAYAKYPGVVKPRQRRRRRRREPNYESGRMLRELRQGIQIRATATRASLRMVGPKYTDVAGKQGQPDKAAEIAFTSEAEQNRLNEFLGNVVTDVQNLPGPKRRRRIAG